MLPGMFLVNMVRKKRIKPEQDAILSDKDKAFIEGRQINTFKGRGVLALEHIESSTFVVEDRGILSQSKHVEDVEGNYLFDFTWNGTRNCIDATKVDCSLGRLLNDDHRNPNCKVKTIIVDGRPHLCLFSIRDIFPDEEVTYNYGDSSWPWRLRELCDEPSVTVTECRVNPSSSVSEKELCDETSVTVTECSVNPSSSVSEKMTCKDKSKTVAKKGDSALTGDEMVH
ncbi:histone-lysine N-methyltransferase set-1-like isoform X4 [Chanodichthys erythropterus]|uniref:histone-lysine N-methyltransferase set-1-like isoform X4 n=1 Tax=Chanodichthys erythropterus TaxID=933992 RepID=UPI00351E6696